MRKSCRDCTRKHLAQALVISHELQWYADSPEDGHLWICVGHLAEAETQIQRDSAFIADLIRQQRLLLIKEGAPAAMKLDINRLINMVTELDQALAKPASLLGLEPDDGDDLIPNPGGSE